MKKKRLSVGIAPDDLQNGDFVAIVKNRRRPRHRMVLGDERDGERRMNIVVEQEGRGIEGVPHKVLSVSWPYCVFGILLPGGEIDGPVIIDLRGVKLLRLTDEFVNAIKAFEKPERETVVDEDDLPF